MSSPPLRRRLAALSVLLPLAACPAAVAQSLNPAGSIGVHDPAIIKEGKTYYIFHTGTRIGVKTSPDLAKWSNAGSALKTLPAWHAEAVPDNRPGDLWAPDISYRDGKFWMYYSVSSFGSRTSAIGLATRASLAAGEWQDEGTVIASPSAAGNFNAIDPNAVTDAEGNVWLAWGSWWNGIFITKLDPLTGKPPYPPAAADVVNIARRKSSGLGIEGAFIVRARGYYHLFVSWDNCCKGIESDYNMRFGRATNVTGPYVDKAGTPLTAGGGTWLDDASGSPGGHNAVFRENGDFYLVYHVYDGRNEPASLQIRRLYFDAGGWPTLDPAAAAIETRPGLASRPKRTLADRYFSALGRRLTTPSGGSFRIRSAKISQ
jgi:arabinan endo-1,5-alpha-L-arabinosidase